MTTTNPDDCFYVAAFPPLIEIMHNVCSSPCGYYYLSGKGRVSCINCDKKAPKEVIVQAALLWPLRWEHALTFKDNK